MRAFARCPVPVVSAVGHEQDTPLCDLAADVRASTPTAAARLVVPDLAELKAGLDRAPRPARRLASAARSNATASGSTATGERLRAAPVLLLERRRVALDHAAARLQALSPRATLARGYAVVRSGGVRAERRRRGRSGQPPRDRARARRSRRDGRGGAAVSDGDAGERDVRGAPPRARGDRRQARARRRRGRRGDRLWQRGEELHRRCAALLEAAEGRIEELVRGRR